MKSKLAVLATLASILVACGNGSSTGDGSDPVISGTGGFVSGAGGASPGGAPLGGAGATCMPGTTAPCACASGGPGTQTCAATGQQGACVCDAPAGQLVCGGRQCTAGGHCTSSGECPGFFSDCFTHAAGLDTCNVYCQSKGLTCAARACNVDGAAFEPPQGFTWGSFSASRSAECGTSAVPEQFAQSECFSPIWSGLKPLDDVVRCCCH